MQALLAGHIVSQGLHTIAALGLPDLIAKGRGSIDDLASATGLHAPSLHRLLRTMASLGVFDEVADGTFSLTPLGATLCADAPNSLRDQALFETSACVWATWAHLLDSLRSGEPSFTAVHGSPLWSYLAAHPETGAVFNRFMTAQSKRQNAAIIQSYDFSGAQTVIDVGGGHGATLAAVLAQHPDMHGVLSDLPEVVNAPALEIAKFADRCQVVGGNALSAVSAGGDIYMLKRVIMSFNDDDAGALLRNCRAAMGPGARVLVIDPMLPDGAAPHYNRLTDLLMLLLLGGRCRSEAAFRRMFDAAGLSLTRVIATGTSNFILEGVIR